MLCDLLSKMSKIIIKCSHFQSGVVGVGSYYSGTVFRDKKSSSSRRDTTSVPSVLDTRPWISSCEDMKYRLAYKGGGACSGRVSQPPPASCWVILVVSCATPNVAIQTQNWSTSIAKVHKPGCCSKEISSRYFL